VVGAADGCGRVLIRALALCGASIPRLGVTCVDIRSTTSIPRRGVTCADVTCADPRSGTSIPRRGVICEVPLSGTCGPAAASRRRELSGGLAASRGVFGGLVTL